MFVEFSSDSSFSAIVEALNKKLSPLKELTVVKASPINSNDSSPPLTYLGLTCDSRKVVKGGVFVAYKGVEADGHAYIDKAIKNGATLIIAEDADALPHDIADKGVSTITVSDGRLAYSRLCSFACNNPFNDLLTIGITGTNGKTTCLWLISQALEALGHSVLHMGTLGIAHGKESVLTGENTTPPCDVMHHSAMKAKQNGATACVMEVTSHGLHQLRTEDVTFDTVVFTNLTRDHLHYHADMEDYLSTKMTLFSQALAVNPEVPCIVGIDDQYGKRVAQWCKDQYKERGNEQDKEQRANLYTFGVQEFSSHDSHTQIKNVSLFSDGVKGVLSSGESEQSFHSPLIGAFNALNFTTAYLVLTALIESELLGKNNYNQAQALSVLSDIHPPLGRMERFDFNGAMIFVDYAHTADALEKALQALRPVTSGKLWAMFGAGGSKDPAKRSGMGGVAKELADCTVLTADNPKTVPIADINRDIMSSGLEPTLIIDDRQDAIFQTLSKLEPGDVLIIAGKGHEDYQFIGTETLTYSDQDAVKKAIDDLLVESEK